MQFKQIFKKITTLREEFCLISFLSIVVASLLALDALIFHLSKPSFLTGLRPINVVGAALESIASILFISGVTFLTLAVLGLAVLSRRIYSMAIRFLGRAVIAILLSIAVYILVERMLYNTISLGVLGSTSAHRFGFFLLFVFQLIVAFCAVSPQLYNFAHRQNRWIQRISGLSVLMIVLIGCFDALRYTEVNLFAEKSYPNIIFIGGDGINAKNTSAYGYSKETTPFLNSVKNETLFLENAYTNSAFTPGSIVSILNGINPAKTKVFHVGFNLNKHYSKKHLPGELRSVGYQTFSIKSYKDSDYEWTDVIQRNMQNAFDEIGIAHLSKKYFLPYQTSSLSKQIVSDIQKKIGHTLFLLESNNPYFLVKNDTKWQADLERTEDAIQVIKNAKQPYFLILHLLGTHGAPFDTKSKYFAQNISPGEPTYMAKYEDAIRDFDDNVRSVFEALTVSGDIDKTVVVIYSDHGGNHTMPNKVPLMIRFPKQEHSGVIRSNVQLIDIAPTILDYIGLDIPEWMDGESLLTNNLNPARPIYAFRAGRSVESDTFPLHIAFMLKCDRAVYIDYRRRSFGALRPRDNTGDCQIPPSGNKSLYDELMAYLESNDLVSSEHSLSNFARYPK